MLPVAHFIAGHGSKQACEKEGREQQKRDHAEYEPAGGNGDGETEKRAKIHGKHTAGLDAAGEEKDRWLGLRWGLEGAIRAL